MHVPIDELRVAGYLLEQVGRKESPEEGVEVKTSTTLNLDDSVGCGGRPKDARFSRKNASTRRRLEVCVRGLDAKESLEENLLHCFAKRCC